MKIVILSTADFHSAVWTNKQHLATGLAAENEVIYIESLGLRAPTLSPNDMLRISRKLIKYLVRSPHRRRRADAGTPENIQIISPTVIPFHKYKLVRLLNAFLLKRQLRSVLRDAEGAILWSFSPLTYSLEDYFGKTIYHSVDLLHTVPRIPEKVVLESERGLALKVDHVVASSRGVRAHLLEAGFSNVLLWENVAHVETFSQAIGKQREDQAVFAGNLTPSKIDVDCLFSVLDSGLSIALAGPINIDGSGNSSNIQKLMKHPRVTYYGNLGLEELAELLAKSKVGLIPYHINDYTSGVFPMKVYEYLAAGLSVVSTQLPNLVSLSTPSVQLVEARQFGISARKLMEAHDDAAAEVSICASRDHSWESRIRDALALISRDETESAAH